MIKKQKDMLLIPKKKQRYRITATLLNAWQYIWDCKKYVKESENDEICYEDKLAIAQEKAKNDFINILNRIPIPDNEAMKKGREYESLVYADGDEEFSPIIENGAFQVTLTKNIEIDNIPIVLYGVLDVLKKGRIYDIKRVGIYKFPKYKSSHQHAMYLELCPNAIDFTYLVCDDKGNHWYENYIRENSENIIDIVREFISYLKANDLLEIFKSKWQQKY